MVVYMCFLYAVYRSILYWILFQYMSGELHPCPPFKKNIIRWQDLWYFSLKLGGNTRRRWIDGWVGVDLLIGCSKGLGIDEIHTLTHLNTRCLNFYVEPVAMRQDVWACCHDAQLGLKEERESYRFKGQFAKYRLDWLDSFFSLIKVQVAER